MKKIITYTALCLIACFLMPSCKMGITKRHYSKGYYVSHSGSKNNTPVVRTEESKVAADKIETIMVSRSVANQTSVNTSVEVQSFPNVVASAPTRKTNVSSKPVYKPISVNSPSKKLKQMVSKVGHGDHEGHAHSLFWIVIMVILILWLLGFLAGGVGLGGLIHILLVIALILFILWLLRVV